MELEPVAIRSGVYSPCRFESYTLRFGQITLSASRWSMFWLKIWKQRRNVKAEDCENNVHPR